MSLCQLCERDVPKLTVHHLVPRSQGRRGEALPTLLICLACHRQLHVLFSNEELARSLNTRDKRVSHPAMERFLKWVRKQSPQTHVRVRRG
ncbi:HNH endonuclease [Deinococcus peraridilitoris]|uniref:HNH domain-containing protein n=1 Tax=Deinococcus peraridilitoris (strain DSM 19664 / LMG 22246 / CIP 109416 / KR-200) TaxID=937777 RepID=L0A758_DEIPD|nr:HNH endonuclease [Deinococcus peraridilitoris]AFZ68890.1 hypothetical protein Deipe_3457 [Deinococcus peraridilitoris DSM 19664]